MEATICIGHVPLVTVTVDTADPHNAVKQSLWACKDQSVLNVRPHETYDVSVDGVWFEAFVRLTLEIDVKRRESAPPGAQS